MVLVGLLAAGAGCGGGDQDTTTSSGGRADGEQAAGAARVCFTTSALHLYGGEALAAIDREGRAAIGESVASVARRSFAPNIRIAMRRLEDSAGRVGRRARSAAGAGLRRVLHDPKLLLEKNTPRLGRAFSHAQRLAEQGGLANPGCTL